MDAFVVNKNSWHYRWLCFYYSSRDEHYSSSEWRREHGPVFWFENEHLRPGDFCQYWRMALLWPSLHIGLNLALFGVGLRILSYTSGAGALSVGKFVAALLVIALVILILAAAWIGFERLMKRLAKSAEPVAEASSSIIQTAYAAWKGKFCPTLKYEESR